MDTRANIMDLEVDLLPRETLQVKVQQYLESEYPNVIHMISLDYIDAFDQDELVKNTLQQADLVLPGEKAILTRHHVDVLETGGIVVDYHGILELADPLRDSGNSFYLVLRNEKEAKIVYRYLIRHFEKEKIAGIYVADGDVTEETLINDINTKLPDVIVLSMDSTDQEKWLENNLAKVNARLCFVIGSVMPLILRENVYVPDWMQRLHLGGVFRWVMRIPYSHSFRRRIFHRKMDDYNIKKKFRR